jgi:hypothetical protein
MKTIWAIVAGLGAMMIISFVMVLVTLAHTVQPQRQQISQTARPVQCNCKGLCIRTK